MKKFILLSLAGLVAISLLACSRTSSTGQDKKELVFGGSAMPYGILFNEAIKPMLEQQGYHIKTLNFSSLDVNNTAINDGTVDFNLDQHTAYLTVYNRDKDTHLYPLVHIPTIPAAFYSDKYRSFTQAPKGATVLIPNDVSNTARALRTLSEANLIQLSPDVDPLLASAKDIISNPRQLRIKEMDSVIIPRSLPDTDFAFASGGIAYQSKMDPAKIVLREHVTPDMEMVVTINEKNKNTNWAKDLKAAYESVQFNRFMREHDANKQWILPQYF
ncbi:MetQ/NlpA family ABC transporter substrate-binding protein [Neisseriaceae bacterium ESL0693]|nr:MetQ/NlpA family ABC transporter substrate-binding protein [Neisseriaceae bacterium ESL0693]